MCTEQPPQRARGIVLMFPANRHAGTSTADGNGRGTSAGQSAAGQLSENHCIVFSNRRTWISAPRSIAPSFLVSPSARQLTVDKSKPSDAAYARATVISCAMPLINDISVKLLRKSTANLLRDDPVNSGYSTAMELKDVLAWIDTRKRVLGLSDAEVEKKAGRPSLVQNMRKTIKNGHGSLPKVASLRALAEVLGEAPAALLEPLTPLSGKPSQNDSSALDELRERQAYFRQKEIEYKHLADAIDVSIAILEKKAS